MVEDIPYFSELESFYNHVKARPPLNKDFDIRRIDPKVLKAYDYVSKPFRHSFYCIALFLQGNITLNTGFWKSKLTKPCLYLKTPCQVVSWAKPPQWLDEYFIVFTDTFILKYKMLADIIFDLPFFRLEKAIPFEIEPGELKMLKNFYDQIMKEYQSDNADKFDLIATYTHSLLIHVRRLYNKYAETDGSLTSHIYDNERLLIEKFRSLIRKKLVTGETSGHHLTVRHVAGLLSTHPNHLNAVVKRQKQKTAIAFLHEQIFYEAQSLLGQSELNIKEISFRLGFADTSHFSHFFKKQSGKTPAYYRKEKRH